MPGISFFIGNGFDLNLGLETRYDQFCKYYLQKNPEDFLAKTMKKDTQLWSNLELALGKVTEQVPDGQENCFGESKDLLEYSLAEYLENEQKKIVIGDEKQIADEMKKYITLFHQTLPVEHRREIEEITQGFKGELAYFFVTFNYTNVLDRCVEAVRKIFNNNLGTYSSANGYQYQKTLRDIIHIHGTTENEMVLGVNDTEQIADRRFKENSLYRQCLVKEETNKRFAQNKIQIVRNVIDKSNIICIFGMSIGETDKMWWQYIGKWLQESNEHRLIIYIRHDFPRKRITTMEKFQAEDDVLKKFKECSGIEGEWEAIKNKIYVICNSNIFDLSIAYKYNE